MRGDHLVGLPKVVRDKSRPSKLGHRNSLYPRRGGSTPQEALGKSQPAEGELDDTDRKCAGLTSVQTAACPPGKNRKGR